MSLSHPELHRSVPVAQIGAAGLERRVEANAPELAALAARLEIPAIHALACRWRLTPGPGGIVEAEGELTARLVRVCVVTLDEFDSAVCERFSLRFVPEGRESAEIDPEAEDEIPYAGAAIDLGEATAEQLALALDPYPRKPGAALPDEAQDAAAHPFATLSRLKPRD